MRGVSGSVRDFWLCSRHITRAVRCGARSGVLQGADLGRPGTVFSPHTEGALGGALKLGCTQARQAGRLTGAQGPLRHSLGRSINDRMS